IITSFSVFILSSVILSQTYQIKQITNFNFDSRNPVFLQYPANLPWYLTPSEIFFEGINNDSAISIYSMTYDTELDSFYQLRQISDSGFINKNAVAKFIEGGEYDRSKLLLWETNQNGNWDIVFSLDSGTGWLPPNSLFSSQEDEQDPSFVQNQYAYWDLPLQILYSKGNSVYLYSKNSADSSVKNELIFEGNDSIKYSNPAGTVSFSFYNKEYIASVEHKEGVLPRIVFREKNIDDTLWSNINGVYDSIPGTKPKFLNLNFGSTTLSFEGFSGGKKKVFLIPTENFGTNTLPEELTEDTSLGTSDFTAYFFEIVTKRSSRNTFESWMPSCFKFTRKDSTFVRTSISDYYFEPYLDVFTKVTDPKPGIGPISSTYEGVISYTAWSDSLDGRVNLFGVKRIDPLGEVKRDLSPKAFSLSQNYPNPFNPSTKILYTLASRQFVTLKIYDLLGREITTLVNEEEQAGHYEVEFSAKAGSASGANLSSGIYFYQLKAGNFIQTKKLVLLK
ncbi:MAG TPA: T9SS type A sorting domain-containing protein, partial [Ignavibacteriaceae bacterium]|nr:T9SS type A sorting domain-containing protein [Ignavibacteriaceae bacterium]